MTTAIKITAVFGAFFVATTVAADDINTVIAELFGQNGSNIKIFCDSNENASGIANTAKKSAQESCAKNSVPNAHKDEVVIILHGLARTRFSMTDIQWALEQAGYRTINHSYPSRQHTVEMLADIAIGSALEECKDATRIHFVTHSIGGILVRQFLKRNTIKQLGHVVMLGPPNKGSEIVDFFQQYKITEALFNHVNGPAGKQMSNASNFLRQLGAVNFSLGVIAGNFSLNPAFSYLIEDENDGKISVESSKVQGMSDHIILSTSHTFMMHNKNVIAQVLHFLEYGEFNHNVH